MRTFTCVATLATITLCGPALAAPMIDLSFTQPSGAASGNDTISVLVSVAVAAGSETVQDYLGDNDARVEEFRSTLESRGFDLSRSVTFDYGAFLTCSSGAAINSFIGANCSSGPYSLSFGPGAAQSSLEGSPGSTVDVLFLSYSPKGGSAPSGLYTTFDLGFNLNASGFNANGGSLSSAILSPYSITGSGSGPFTRTVTAAAAVPEPASWAMMITGFGLTGAALRRARRRTRVSVAFG